MNYNQDKKYLYWGLTAFCVIAASMLFYTFLTNMSGVMGVVGGFVGFFTPVIYGFVFAYLLAPVMNFFEKKCFRAFFFGIEKRRVKKGKVRTPEEAQQHTFKVKRVSRALGVLTTVLVALTCLVGLISAVLPEVFASITTIVNNTPEYIATIQGWDLAFLNAFPEAQEAVYDFLQNIPTILQQWLQDNVLPRMTDIVSSVTSGVWTTLSTLLNIILGLIISVYLLHGKELFAAQGKKVLYGLLSVGYANLILRNVRDIHKKFGGFITGKLVESLIIGAFAFIIFTILEMPFVVLVSAIIGITNIIPFFGPIIGAIIAAPLILVGEGGGPMQCLIFLIIMFIIQQIDGNWLGPKILGDSTGLSSFWVIFAIVVGQRMFGFIGLLVGVPIFAFMYAIFKARVTRALYRKEMPLDSNFYRNVSHFETQIGNFVFFDETEKQKKVKKEKKKGKGFKNLFKKKVKEEVAETQPEAIKETEE